MTIQFLAGKRITGLSTDIKPTGLSDHFIFHETDTGDDYTLLNDVWIKKSSQSTLEASTVLVDDALIFPDNTTQASGTMPLGIEGNVSTQIFKQSFTISEDANPGDVFFKQDGKKMYVVGFEFNKVYEYDLGVAWNLSTAVFLQDFLIGQGQTQSDALYFRHDGKKMYVGGRSADVVLEFDLGTAWDVTTAVFLNSFSIPGADGTNLQSIHFKPDGLSLFIIDNGADSIFEYKLTIPWDLSTAGPNSVKSFNIISDDANMPGLYFKDDGTKMYTSGLVSNSIFQYDLLTPWDITTAILTETIDITSIEGSPNGLFFKPDNAKMYVMGSPDVHEFDLGLITEGIMKTPNLLDSANATVHVKTLADFPAPVSSVITLEVNTTYIIEAPIVTPFRFEIPDGSQNGFTTANRVANNLVYIGTDTFFTSAAGSTSGRLDFFNITIASAGGGTIFDLDGHDMELFKCIVTGFAKFGTIKNATIVHIRLCNIAFIQKGMKFINVGLVNILQAAIFNAVDTNESIISVLGANTAVSIVSSQIIRLANESTIYIDPLIGNNGILLQQIAGTIGSGSFKTGSTDSITQFADSTVDAGVKTTVTSTTHGLIDDEIVNITGTTSYNGTFIISNVTLETFDIEVVFVADDATGTWDSNSIDGTDPRVTVVDVLNEKDSTVSGDFSFINIATPQLVTIVSTSTPVTISGGSWTSSNLERLVADVGNNGIATYTGVETADFQVTFSALLEKVAGGATNIGLTILINGVDITTNAPHSVNAGIIQISATRIFTLNTGDTLQLAVFNDDNTDNIEISQANMSINS